METPATGARRRPLNRQWGQFELKLTDYVLWDDFREAYIAGDPRAI
jgi:hypothetical protein